MKTLALTLAVLSTIHPLHAANNEIDWMTSYYQSPSPERVFSEFKKMAEKGLLDDESKQAPMIGFLSQIMAANPNQVRDWLEQFEGLEENPRKAIWTAAWYSDTAEARSFFEAKGLQAYLKESPPKILELPADNPSTLDMLWGHFLATRAKEPIRRIITALSHSRHMGALERYKSSKKSEQDKREAFLEATYQSAMWSLESNCRQHPLVLQHCEAIYKDPTLDGNQRLCLGILLSKLKPDKYKIDQITNKGEQHRNQKHSSPGKSEAAEPSGFVWRDQEGNPVENTREIKSINGFGARVSLTSNANFYADWAKPQTPKITIAEKAEINQEIVPVIIYVNPMKNEKGEVDVTFDLKIIRPDGTVAEEMRDLVGYQGPFEAPQHNLQLVQTEIRWKTEPGDQLGNWLFQIVVRDNVRGTTIPLETSLKAIKKHDEAVD